MSDSNPTFKIQKKYILGLGNWLNSLSLVGRESRERTKFVEMLAEDSKENELMRVELVKKYAETDATGELVIVKDEKEGEHYNIPDDKMSEFQKEMMKYLDEDFVIQGEGNKQRLNTVKSIVLDTQEKISGQFAVQYDAWCDAFEKMEV